MFWGVIFFVGFAYGQNGAEADQRARMIRHLDLTYSFGEYRTKEEWLSRASKLRGQILASAGLLPMPDKQQIKPVIFDKLDRGDFTVEKVMFESYPGFYVTGNLYRPKNISGKAPAVLCPHGHWAYGRLENTSINSGPARAIVFARQGYVAFSYDMVGYNDSSAITHKFADHNIIRREALWSVNLLGLQLWNSIRAIDFLLTLPEVDTERIACTGESGGGTQTFLLIAVDERIKVASPVNMVSFSMQGGSLCENAPNLRIDTNNVELAALMAPRPMLLVSATGDWTKNMLKDEYPAIRNIYRLLNAEDKIAAIQVDAPHNYNQESREAVYGWFAHWMLGRTETTPIKERGGGIPSIPELLVFFNRQRPENELNESQLAGYLIESRRKQIIDLQPDTLAELQKYKDTFLPTFNFSLMAEYPREPIQVVNTEDLTDSSTIITERTLSRKGMEDRVRITIVRNAAKPADSIVLLVSSQTVTWKSELVDMLVKSGHTVAILKNFRGTQFSEQAGKYRYYTTYNRTDIANQVQDILTAISYLNHTVAGELQNGGKKPKLNIAALGQAGLWVLLAKGYSPEVHKMVVDAGMFDTTSDDDYLKYLPVPGIRRAGDFQTALAVSPLIPLLIHNTGNKFRTDNLSEIYRRFGDAENFKTLSAAIDNKSLVKWLSSN